MRVKRRVYEDFFFLLDQFLDFKNNEFALFKLDWIHAEGKDSFSCPMLSANETHLSVVESECYIYFLFSSRFVPQCSHTFLDVIRTMLGYDESLTCSFKFYNTPTSSVP